MLTLPRSERIYSNEDFVYRKAFLLNRTVLVAGPLWRNAHSNLNAFLIRVEQCGARLIDTQVQFS